MYHTPVSHTRIFFFFKRTTHAPHKITTQLCLHNSDYMTQFCPAPPSGRATQTHFQLPSLSSRSDDLEVSSTWNRSMSILMIRAWMVIPRCRTTTTTTTADYVQERNTFQPRQMRTKSVHIHHRCEWSAKVSLL